MDRIERLLRLGYLPSQLPPPFRTGDLATHYATLLTAWHALAMAKNSKIAKAPSSKSEIFSVARAGHQRRATSLVHPVAQTFLCKAVVENWAGIVSHFRRSRLSASHPRFRRGAQRAASLPSMQTLYERRLLSGAGYRYVLRSDISRFFPTIYTHSIPWALHGKAAAKKNRNVTPKYFGNLLDLSVRQCQDEQTFGLPIGPDTSHIIAECIATAIDLDLGKKLRLGVTGFRYVDDYYFFFETQPAAEAALAHLVRSLKDFELQINFEKTKICRTEDLVEDSWTHTLRSFHIGADGLKQRSDVNHYFEVARELARRHSDESVMVYALRRSSSVILRKENWETFEAQLCLVAASHPVTLQTIARVLSTYAGLGYPISKLRLSRLMNSLLSQHAPVEHHSEVAWCLWICKNLGLDILPGNVDAVAEMQSSVCSLLLLDMAASGSLPKAPAPSRWKQYEKSDSLWDDLWLLSYEAGVRGWGGMSDAHIAADPYFNELRKHNVRFYDTGATLAPTLSPKPDALKKFNLETIAQLLEVADLEAVFDHEDDDDEYGSPLDSDEDDNEYF
jgi:Reverse transcriptase (RNA-dependent DNA polymerase)